MGIPGNAALCDIILCGHWPDHCSSPEHFVSDSVIPDFAMNPSKNPQINAVQPLVFCSLQCLTIATIYILIQICCSA